MTHVAIIDSGGANIASVRYAFDRLGATSELTTDAETIRSAPRVLLPGVGAARDAMRRLRAAGLTDVIRELQQPVLGICLGMQLMCEASEEEDTDCLGIFTAAAKQLSGSPDRPVPNMGWCATSARSPHPLLRHIDDGSYFYYVHGYAIPVTAQTVATAEHSQSFSAILARDNFVAAQFHPERSSDVGAKLLQNFVRSSA
ncbi:MAG: imidazole glycerol phosphate synthase subunit HisH [Gammaproteobacteria bacterium]|nr:imidazole glycerol phosphate synthase subunit HisH [Gammaproteobacteria bacterium]